MNSGSSGLRILAQKLREKTPNTTEREAFLASLKERIRSGEYQLDADALADALLEELRRSEAEG